jgi:hypothetical protein
MQRHLLGEELHDEDDVGDVRVLGEVLVLVGVARGGAMREDRGGELARAPQVLADRPRRRSATPSGVAALAATPPLKNGLARLSPPTSPGR